KRQSAPSIRWLCPSTKPGSSTWSAKRSSSWCGPQPASSSRVPAPRMRPSRTATWVATGRAGFIVWMRRARKTVIGCDMVRERRRAGGWRTDQVEGRGDERAAARCRLKLAQLLCTDFVHGSQQLARNSPPQPLQGKVPRARRRARRPLSRMGATDPRMDSTSNRTTPDVDPRRSSSGTSFWRYVLIGVVTVAPLWVTWLVLDFIFRLLSRTGAPLLWGAARGVRPFSEDLAEFLVHPSVQYVLAALATLIGLYFIGVLTSMVVGRRLIAMMERLVARLPLVQTIYGATKRLMQALQKPPTTTGQRVVLISFPSRDMKTIGFVTKVL